MLMKTTQIVGVLTIAAMFVSLAVSRPPLETSTAADGDDESAVVADDDDSGAEKDETTIQMRKFPEQDLGSPLLLEDGQNFWDKLFVMKMMHLLEQDATIEDNEPVAAASVGDYVFEGDIILTTSQAFSLVQISNNEKRRRHKRKMDVDVTSWTPKKKWTMPINYIFHHNHTARERTAIRAGLQLWETETCITFTNNESYTDKQIKFTRDRGCYAYIGQNPHRINTTVSIGAMCIHIGTVAHEIGHVLGFWHEHARPDRDEYLKIIWKHVRSGDRHNFQQLTWGDVNNLGVQFDYGSLMMYGAETFSTEGKSIESVNGLFTYTIGQRDELSFYDVKLANKVYCNDTCDPADLAAPCLHDGYQDPKNCSRCRCAEGLAGDQCQTVAPSRGNCGGVVNLTASVMVYISAPDYPGPFPSDVACYWLVRSTAGSSVRMQFIEPYIQSESCNTDDVYKPCRDYVEVRFTDNLGMTGGRLCCNDSTQGAMMSSAIVSHSNHSLIVFRSYQQGHRGFQMRLTIDSCGGCHNKVTSEQPPCKRHVIYDCTQKWTSIVQEAGCGWLGFGCYNTYKIVTKTRQSKCYEERPYCCHGYTLANNSTVCVANVTSTNTTDDETTPDSDSSNSTTEGKNSEESDQGSVWSTWNSWSTCSRDCGSCGTQNRSRSCLDESGCSDASTETRACGSTACPVTARYCSVRTLRYYDCSTFFEGPKTCTEYLTTYKIVVSGCCCGYLEKDGMCVEGAV